jgi:hypothetical protein
MLNALTKLISLYLNSLGIKRLSRIKQMESDLAEANLLAKEVERLQAEVAQEQDELKQFLRGK